MFAFDVRIKFAVMYLLSIHSTEEYLKAILGP
jgi:hypothetical protein